ncbi:MAG: AmmeMemoRadiSam system protein B [Candidatus Bipolaricaulia bacterium]
MKVRRAYAAGRFYEADRARLIAQIERCFQSSPEPGEPSPRDRSNVELPVGLVLPHAGYPYSGGIAAHGYRLLAERDPLTTAIIIGTNHTGRGGAVSIALHGTWETPMGIVEIDSDLANRIRGAGSFVRVSDRAFEREHSIEVQLPFLQYLFGTLRFVPLVVLDPELERMITLGETVAEALQEKNGNAVVIASSDFSHFVPHEIAKRGDHIAIQAILRFDLDGFYQAVVDEKLLICGPGAIAAVMTAAQSLGLRRAELLQYATSAATTGDYERVVGYASIAFLREPAE